MTLRTYTGTFIPLAAAIAFAAGTARAADRDDSGDQRRESNRAGLYLGVGLGDFSTEIDDIDNVDDANLDFDTSEDAFKVFAGWRFNRFFAVQVDQYDFGRSTVATNLLSVSADTKGTAASVVGTLPLGPIELFARAGEIWYDLDVDVSGSNGSSSSVGSSGHDSVYSAGIGFTVAKRLNLKAEYERINISDFSDANAVWLSAAWRF
ncbi:MAG TPA: outer membrane beta-barrel protein [Gammaproteobacteria bacterium]|nr:outer membrane beta-barrel protein [Gammaproteobacteria bacterium]